jgi:hypothetical protein
MISNLMKLARILALLTVAVVGLSYALDAPLWVGALTLAPTVVIMIGVTVYDNIWGVHAETRRLIAEGRRLAEETAKLPV